jgi:uncharacterized membrane protein
MSPPDAPSPHRFRPLHAALLVLAFSGAVLAADFLLEGGFARADYARVAPDARGTVRIAVADLAPGQVRFYRYLNTGNQEVKFFVGRDEGGHVQVAFDANEICFKRKRGYSYADGWLTCRVCDKAFRLAEVNAGGGGCKPVPIAHRLEGDELVLADADILQGWRFFR